MLLIGKKQEQEIKRYENAYRHLSYKMGDKRKKHATAVLRSLPRGSLLDVGAGRGEGVKLAKLLGFDPVVGLEPVEYLVGGPVIHGVATHLPFDEKSFDTVMCLDVLEHLVEEDIKPALKEARRVAKSYVFLTASDQPHFFKDVGDLHISKKPVAEWQALFESLFPGDEIKFLGKVGVSPGWLVELHNG